MKSVSAELAAHLGEEVTTLAACWKLRRRDGVIHGFTTHDRDIVFAGITYRAGTGFTPTMIEQSDGLAVDNLDVSGALDSACISEAEIAEGRLDRAAIEIFLVNWADPSQGRLLLRSGYLGDIAHAGGRFTAEVRGLMQTLQQSVGETYSPECRARLGDRRCKVALHAFRLQSRLTAIVDARSLTGEGLGRPDGWFDYGTLRWHTGANAGLTREVRRYQGDVITLHQPPPNAMAVGDLFEITAGCDKRLATCRDKFDNVLNFRGEPFVPGTDSLLDYPGLR